MATAYGTLHDRSEPRALEATDETAAAPAANLLLAGLSAAAGIIHLAMVPSHMDEWALEGVGFALAGLFQIMIAGLLLTRPSRIALVVAIAVNAALIATWAVSRTAGLPFGPNSGHRELATFIDVACVALEGAFIAAAALSLQNPRWADAFRLPAIALSLGAVALATAAVASPSAREHAAHGHGHADDNGLSLLTNGHHHDIVQYELDAPTQAALDAQLKVTREVARQFPTVADAEAAGYRRAGPYSPGLGAHYVKYGPRELNGDGTIDGDDMRYPLAIMYDGTDPDSNIAGFMFYSTSATEPQGFAGPNDTWHYHENVCLKTLPGGEIDAPFGPDNSATEAQCASVGGSIMKLTQWMVHVWSVPGWGNTEGGVFAEVNPELMCPDGTYYQLPVDEWATSPLTTCRTAN
jgi:hypothetical protein